MPVDKGIARNPSVNQPIHPHGSVLSIRSKFRCEVGLSPICAPRIGHLMDRYPKPPPILAIMHISQDRAWPMEIELAPSHSNRQRTNLNDVRTILLAGGKGTRLKPFTAVLPKPLVPLGEMPIIEILLRRLQVFGIQQVTIATGYLANLIRAVCGDGERFGLEITYAHEHMPLGTAGPIGLVDNRTDPTLVMNGDLLTTLDLSALMRQHEDTKADITIAVHRRSINIDFGVVETSSTGLFTGFREKPVYEIDVSMGINVLSSKATSMIPSDTHLDMPELILKVRDAGGKICCFQARCFWLDIGRMEDYGKAQEEFAQNESLYLGACTETESAITGG